MKNQFSKSSETVILKSKLSLENQKIFENYKADIAGQVEEQAYDSGTRNQKNLCSLFIVNKKSKHMTCTDRIEFSEKIQSRKSEIFMLTLLVNAKSKHMKCSHISEILFLCCSPSSRRASIARVCTLFDFQEKSKDRHTQNFACWENPNPLKKSSAMLPREYEKIAFG